jgi:hypothetical protein
MHALLGLPLWVIALVLAAFAPFCARAWGTTLERRVRERSVRLLAGLGAVTSRVHERGSNVGRERLTKDGEVQS